MNLIKVKLEEVKALKKFFSDDRSQAGEEHNFRDDGTGFILNLENLGNRPFYENSEKPGIVREFSIIFIQVRENELFSQHIILIYYWHDCSLSRCSKCCP